MKQNRIEWKNGHTPVRKFINTLMGITHRGNTANEIYKYERSALILVDIRQSPPQIFLTLEELKKLVISQVILKRILIFCRQKISLPILFPLIGNAICICIKPSTLVRIFPRFLYF